MVQRLLLIIILPILLTGCITINDKLRSGSSAIQRGFTKDQVAASLGAPPDTQINGNYEAWRYCTTAVLLSGDDYTTVIFKDGTVIATENYKNYLTGDCTSFFQPVYWSKYVPSAPVRQSSGGTNAGHGMSELEKQLVLGLLRQQQLQYQQPGYTSGCDSGHWVKKVMDSGRFVFLENGSVWEISAIDRIDTTLWLPVTDITICDGNTLINTDDQEKVSARRLR